MSGSSAFYKPSLYIWKFLIQVLLKPTLMEFEHNLTSLGNKCNCLIVWTFFSIALVGNWEWRLTFLQSCGHYWVFHIFWHIKCFWYLQFSVSLHCPFKKAFLSLLTILWNSAFSWTHFSLSPLLFASLLSSDIYKAASDNHFVFLHFFFFEIVLVRASCTILWNSAHSSSAIPWIY